MKNRIRPAHPGEILREELEELSYSAAKFAALLHVPVNRITTILNGQRSITADTALRLARFFGSTPEFWLDLQISYDVKVASLESGKKIESEVKHHAA